MPPARSSGSGWTRGRRLAEPERTFLHRYYDAVVVGGEWTRGAVRGRAADAARAGRSRSARRGPTSSSTRPSSAAARARVLAAHPALAGRRVVLYAPTFRGRGDRQAGGAGARRRTPARRPPAPTTCSSSRRIPTSIRRPRPTAGYDVVADPAAEINDLLALTDILITDYSSSVVEFALLRRPIVLLVGDLAEYEVDPGLYLDYRTEMIGTQVTDTDGVIDAIAAGRFDLTGYDAFIERQLGLGARRRQRPLRRALPRRRPRRHDRGGWYPSARCPPRVRSRQPFAMPPATRGPLALVREGIADIRSRRRLVRYLVQADIRKRGADTLLGNIWWVLDPLLQMVVYVVFLSIVVAQRQPPDYPLFIFSAILPWKWFSASITDATDLDRRQDQLIKQIQFPKIVLPVAATTAGIVSFAFGTVALGMLMLFFSDRISPYLVFIPVIAAVQFVFTLACALPGRRRERLLPRPRQRRRPRPAPVVVPVARAVQPGDPRRDAALQGAPVAHHARERQPVRDPVRGLPDGHLRHAGRRRRAGRRTSASLAILLVASTILLALTTIVFKRLEPNFAKVI